MKCFTCKKEVALSDKPGFREECPHCFADIHICYNCQFYDDTAYNDCRETSADRVVDKEKANYCEYFVLRSTLIETNNTEDDAKKKLEALFKK